LNDENNTFLSVGFTGGYAQRSFDPSKATFNNQYQGGKFNNGNATGEQLGDPKFSYWDLGAGITYSSSMGLDHNVNYFIGLAGYHLTQPKNSFYTNSVNLDMKWNVNAGLSAPIDERYSFQLHANYLRQGTYNELIAGGLLGWNKMDEVNGNMLFSLYAGVFYRMSDALIPTLKVKYKDYAFGFSYDANVSTLKAATNVKGGYEISIVKTGFFYNPEGFKSRTICPHF
jgi:type IX secretion system PorP/SprF family membrane protein